MKRPSLLVLFASLVAVAPGCWRSSGHPETYPATGIVTLNGKPVEGASVMFISSGAPRFSMGKTDVAGKFSLSTYEPDDGAFAGTHAVVVVKKPPRPTVAEPAANPDAPAKPADIDAAMAQQAKQAVKAAQTPSLLPQKYADESTTDLHVEVGTDENFFEIKLVD